MQLIGLAGLVLGWISWQAALMSGPIVLAVGGLWAVALLAAGRRGQFAFAPAVFLGALTAPHDPNRCCALPTRARDTPGGPG